MARFTNDPNKKHVYQGQNSRKPYKIMGLPSKKIRQGLVKFDMLFRNFKKAIKIIRWLEEKANWPEAACLRDPDIRVRETKTFSV